MRNKILGVFLVFITIPIVLLAILTVSSMNFKSPLFYKELFNQKSLYTPATLAIRSLPQSDDKNNFWSAVIPQITAPWLRENVEMNLDNFNIYLTQKNASFELYLNIAPFKDAIIKNIPIGLSADDIPDKLTLGNYSQILEKIQASQTDLTKKSGVDTDSQIKETQNVQTKALQNTSQIKKGYTYFKIYTWIIISLALILLILIGLAARRDIRAIFRWIGVTLLISGLILVIPALLLKTATCTPLLDRINSTPEMNDLMSSLVKSIIEVIAANLLRNSLIISGLGLVMLIVSLIIPKPKIVPKATPKASPPTQITEVRDIS